MQKRLFRSRTNRILGGVAGGLGEYFDVDPALVRFIFLILLFVTSGFMVIVYLLSLVVIPEEPFMTTPGEVNPADSVRHMAENMKEKAHSFAKDMQSREFFRAGRISLAC